MIEYKFPSNKFMLVVQRGKNYELSKMTLAKHT